MANTGYIGKISALVTASTADLERKLRGATGDVTRFGRSLSSTLAAASSSAERSLNGIFTPLQRIQRAIQVGRGGRLRLVDDRQVQQIQRAVSVTEGINKPLAAATRQFQGLSAEVQSAFLPALDLAQRRVSGLNDLLSRSGNVSETAFTKTAERVERTTQAIQRLTQAQRAASAGFTGNELEFSNPRALEEINAAAAASRRAGSLPASQREDPAITARVRQLSQLRNLIAQTVAQVERLRIDPQVNNSAIQDAEARLANIIETTRRAREEFASATGTRTPEQQKAAENEIALLQRREQAGLRAEQQRQAQLQRAADNEIALLQRREQAGLRAEQQRIASAERTVQNEIALLQRREQAELRAEQQRQAQLQRAADNEIALLQRREQAGLRAEKQRIASAERTVQNEIALLQRREQAGLRAEQQRQAQLQRAADNEIALLQRREQAGLRAEQQRIASAERTVQNEIALLQRREQAGLRAEQQRQAQLQATQSRLKAVQDGLRQAAAPLSSAPRDPFELLKRSAEQAKQAIDRVSDASRRQQLQQRLVGVQAAIAADAGNTNLSQAQLARLAARRARALDEITASASARSATDIFGPALGSARTRLDGIQSQIASLQSGIAALPRPLQTRLIPALNRAREAFAALGNSPAAAQIAAASRQAQNLEKQLLRAQQAAQFRGTFRNFLNDTSASRYAAQLESVQRQLAGVGATAGGPVASAINLFRRQLAAAANAGTLGTRRTRLEMEQLTQSIARAAVQTGLFTQAQAAAFSRSVASAGLRQGDIGRFGVDRLSLGLNQLAFAVDDLFSASGGLEQRIRAVSNNITQLGFVTGGTTGLFIGLAAVIGGQVFLAYQRFINKGVEAQDRVKQLSEAARRQRDLVKQLAKAFDELSDDLAQRGLTEVTRRADQLAARLRDVTKNLQELRRQRLADVDPDVQDARRQQAVLRRRLDAAETPGSRIAIQARLDRQIEAERQATARVLGEARAVDIAGSVSNIVEQLFRTQLAEINDAGGVQAQAGVPLVERTPESRQFTIDTARSRAESAFALVDLNNRAEVRAAAVAQRDRLVDVAEQRTVVGFRTTAAARAEESLAVVERLIRQIDDVEQQAAIGRAAEGVTEAVNSVDSVLPDFLKRIEEASEFARTPALALQQEVEGLVQALRRQTDAISKAREEGNVEAANEASSRAKSIADEIVARERQVAAVENTARTVESFADVLEQVSSQLAESIVSDTRSAADQTRRNANRLAGLAESGLAQPRDAEFAQRQRRRQEAALSEIEGRAAEARRQERLLFSQFQQQAENGALGARAQELIRQRDEAQAVLDNQESTPNERAAAEINIDEANRRLRQFYESLPGVLDISGFLDSLDSAAQAAIELGNAVEQGRKLVLTDAQRTADDFIAQVQQLNAAREAGEIDQAQRREAIERLRQEGFRQLAPTIFGLADQVQNAVLQGPSRAPLQAADVSTVEGNRELNRLLRGEDSAREQPLVDLQREANRIAERIARGVENNEAQVANN
jgi:hypothetical protein